MNKKIRHAPLMGRAAFEHWLSQNFTPSVCRKIALAYRLAKYGHRNQFRRDGITRYFDHKKSVALIIGIECGVTFAPAITVGLIHDLMEDTYILTWDDVEWIFGSRIYRGLRLITKEHVKQYYANLLGVQRSEWWVLLVKLADRLHNLRSLAGQPPDFQLKQLRETLRYYPALLKRYSEIVPKRFRKSSILLQTEIMKECERARLRLAT
jgi:GTP diphosphokinase / guanosine-3',5'-bis(diphosphate) 3'-diphosphatase